VPPADSLDGRWAAPTARGAEHDRLPRRTARIALPLLGAAAALVMTYLLIGARL
jgi:hypothetical protein